jgi:hypothetical protein
MHSVPCAAQTSIPDFLFSRILLCMERYGGSAGTLATFSDHAEGGFELPCRMCSEASIEQADLFVTSRKVVCKRNSIHRHQVECPWGRDCTFSHRNNHAHNPQCLMQRRNEEMGFGKFDCAPVFVYRQQPRLRSHMGPALPRICRIHALAIDSLTSTKRRMIFNSVLYAKQLTECLLINTYWS